MTLTEAEKRKIEEEEKYRSELRSGVFQEKHDKVKSSNFFGLVGNLIKWILILIVGIIFARAFMQGFNSYDNPSTDTPKSSPSYVQKDLTGKVSFDGSQFHIENQDSRDWSMCKFTLNSDYKFPDGGAAYELIKVGEILDLYPEDFTQSDGTRFNIYSIKPQQIFAYCWVDKDTPASVLWTW